jgi:hypothetical protein
LQNWLSVHVNRSDWVCRIPDESTPESRMMAVVEWYLTSFHAGRKVCCIIICNWPLF